MDRIAIHALRSLSLLLLAAGLGACGRWIDSAPSFAPRDPYAESTPRLDKGDRVLYSFEGSPDGMTPSQEVVFGPAGTLVSTTDVGGLHEPQCGQGGCGVVYQLTPEGSGYTEEVLHYFKGPSYGDGDAPFGNLIAGPHGEFYGTTYSGGKMTQLDGTVFELKRTKHGYAEKILYEFPGYPYDGVTPYGGLVRSSSGTLYGTTGFGGKYGFGTVFALAPAKGGFVETLLHSFDGHDGSEPVSQPSIDAHGSLYGTTNSGGESCGGYGCGVIFKMTKTGTSYDFNVISLLSKKIQGFFPSYGVLLGNNGTVYATTQAGGRHGCGTIFQLKPQRGRYVSTILHAFDCDGGPESPHSVPASGPGGVIYGTTANGGNPGCPPYTCGTVFSLVPSSKGYHLSTVYEFKASMDGSHPNAGVIVDSSGTLYGTTFDGGAFGLGTVYEITTPRPEASIIASPK